MAKKTNYFAPMKKALKGKNSLLWIGGAVVVFVFFYFAFSRGGSGDAKSSGGNFVMAGPSDAEIAAAMQGQAANLAASVEQQRISVEAANRAQEIELAGTVAALEAESRNREIDLAGMIAGNELILGQQAFDNEIEAQRMGYNAQLDSLRIDSMRRLESENIAAEVAMRQIHSQENMFISQLENNRDMFAEQMASARFATAANAIGTLKQKDRDTALGALLASSSGQYYTGGTGDDRITIGGNGSYNPFQPSARSPSRSGYFDYSGVGNVGSGNAGYIPGNAGDTVTDVFVYEPEYAKGYEA